MSLVACPECGKTVSSFADVCPFCGFPFSKGFHTKIYFKGKIYPNWMPVTITLNGERHQIDYSDIFANVHSEASLIEGKNCVVLECFSLEPTVKVETEYIDSLETMRNRWTLGGEPAKCFVEALILQAGRNYLFTAKMNQIPVSDEYSSGYYEDGIIFEYQQI